MKARIFADPKFQEQINDGLLKPWQQFANDINILGNLVSAPTTLSAGQTASVIELFAFRKKSEWLRFFEANPRIVKYAQKGLLQAILRPIIGSH
jgi:hypothetical protein